MSVDVDTKIAASICKEFRTLVSHRINLVLEDRRGLPELLTLRSMEVHATGARQVDAWVNGGGALASLAADLLDMATIPTYGESGDGYITMVKEAHYRFCW